MKAAAFAAFLRVFFYSLESLQADYSMVLWVLAVATMTLGNVVAIAQENIKRMLAYSSIAHAGYILVGMVAGGEAANASILYYVLAYALMNMGAFAVVVLYGNKGEENIYIEDYKGMGTRYPVLGAAMALFMFSLAGLPPTAGFMGKFYVFSAAVAKGYVWLVVIAVLNSLVSVYYYFRVTIKIYMQPAEKEITPICFGARRLWQWFLWQQARCGSGLFPTPIWSWPNKLFPSFSKRGDREELRPLPWRLPNDGKKRKKPRFQAGLLAPGFAYPYLGLGLAHHESGPGGGASLELQDTLFGGRRPDHPSFSQRQR